MSTLFDDLAPARHGVAVPGAIQAFLSGLQATGDKVDDKGVHSGAAQGGVDTKLLGFFTVSLAPFGPSIPYRWKQLPGGGFQLDLLLTGIAAMKKALKFADPNSVLHAAKVESEPDPAGGPPRVWLSKTGQPLELAADLALRVHGTPTSSAAITWLKPVVGPDPQDDVFVVQPAPTQILFGDSGFGVDIPHGIIVDNSAIALAPSSPSPGWTGVAIPNAKLYVPRDIPLIGGHAIDFDLQLGTPGGLHASAATTIAAAGSRPAIDVRLEWEDPGAASLADVLPTAIEATAKFPVAGRNETAGGKAFTLAGGDPLTVRVRCSRALQPAASVAFEVSVDAAGPDGLVKATGTDPGGKAVVTAAALATALIADSALSTPAPSGDESGIWLHELLAAASAASAFFDAAGKVVIDRATLALSTAGSGQAFRLSIDYLVDVKVKTFDLGGAMSIKMADNRPMRIRYRNVAIETTGDDLASIHLNFAAATLDVEDPGSWIVKTPGSLLDIIGTRSGHGSLWYEIDLKFKANLGPITVSDATVRLTADGGGGVDLELRGLGVDITTPALTGHGQANITDDGFSADLLAKIGKPLGVGARAYFAYRRNPAGGDDGLLLEVVGSLPGPIPLGPTGLGLYSLGGMFGLNMRPELPPGDDIVERQLAWTRKQVTPDAGAMMFGLTAGVGTVHDLAFTFSATGNLIVTVPEVAFRLAVNAAVLRPPDFLKPETRPLKGLIVVDEDGITVGARADFDVEHLVKVKIPLDARLPFTDPSSWYFRLGSDGAPGRPPGPMTATVLPELFDIGGAAYLMIQGDDMSGLGGNAGLNLPGPAIGFGFAVDVKMGAPPVWLQLSARAAAGMATNPWFLAGSGTISGALHLGPFSIGAHATLTVQLGPGAFLAADFRVCGSIDLWFTEIEGCVSLHIGPDKADVDVPDPGPWHATKMSLSDRHYVEVAEAATTAADAPIVWPDVVPILQFDLGPETSQLQTSFVVANSLQASGATGNDKLRYIHRLTKVELWHIDAGVPKQLTDDLEAAWQQPKQAEVGGASAGNPAGARELALLTHRADMWAHRRSDGAAGTAPDVDPVAATAKACRVPHRPSPGWALGDRAQFTAPDWLLPAEAESGQPVSHFTATIALKKWGRGIQLSEAAMAGMIPAPFTFRPAGVRTVEELTVLGRSFTAGLRLPMVSSYLPLDESLETLGNDPQFKVTVIADTTLRDATLWAVLDRTFVELHEEISIVDIDSGADWIITGLADLPGNRLGVCYTAPTDTRGVKLAYPTLQGITIIGLHGITITAVDAAKAAAAAAAKAAETVSEHNNAPPPFRTPLKLVADALYKVVVVTQTEGKVNNGAPTLFPEPAPNEEVHEYWFRTAKLPPPGAVVVHRPPIPELAWREYAWTQAVFKTEHLARYLSSYTPGDRTRLWYLDDPLVVNFDQDHVDQLAGLYGYTLDLQCKRTDGPPSSQALPNPWEVLFDPIWQDLVDTDVLDPLDRRYLEVNPDDSCPIPKSGASLGAPAENLQPLATYQLYVAVLPTHVDDEPDAPPAEPLPGIIFSTSRYRGPGQQLADLGFGTPPGSPHGQLIVTPAPLGPPQISDATYAAALTALGLEGWPLPASGRTSLLWSAGGTKLAGVLVESPEPLLRPGRFEVNTLQVNGVAFAGLFGDSARCRYLFVPAAPVDVAPSTAVTLVLGYTDGAGARTATCSATSPAAGEVIL